MIRIFLKMSGSMLIIMRPAYSYIYMSDSSCLQLFCFSFRLVRSFHSFIHSYTSNLFSLIGYLDQFHSLPCIFTAFFYSLFFPNFRLFNNFLPMFFHIIFHSEYTKHTHNRFYFQSNDLAYFLHIICLNFAIASFFFSSFFCCRSSCTAHATRRSPFFIPI